MANKEEEIEEEIKRVRAYRDLYLQLRDMGLDIKKSEFENTNDIIGRRLSIEPVRIGMPGTKEEGLVLGPPKRDTRYPVDSIKVIEKKQGNFNVLFVDMHSSYASNRPGDPYAPSKPITSRALNASFDAPTFKQKQLPPGLPEPKQLPPGPEPFKQITAGPERKLLPVHPEQPRLPAHEEPKRLPSGPPEPKRLLPGPPEPKLLPEHNFYLAVRTLQRNGTPIKGVPVRIDGDEYLTNESGYAIINNVTRGEHDIRLPVKHEKHDFAGWDDAPNEPPVRKYNINGRNAIVIAYYTNAADERLPPQKLTIESTPMLQVPIKIFKIVAADWNALEIYLGGSFALTGDRLTAVMTLAREFKDRKFKNSEESKEWLDNKLKAMGIRDPRGITEAIIEHMPSRKEIENADVENLGGAGRWRPTGSNFVPIEGNYKTKVYMDLPAGEYIIIAPDNVPGTLGNADVNAEFYHGKEPAGGAYKFQSWEIYKASLGVRQPRVATKSETKIILDESTRMVANYSKSSKDTLKFEDKRYPGQNRGRQGSALDTSFRTGTFGAAGIRGKISRDVTPRKLSQDPHILAAVNKGKRILNKYAKAEYSIVYNPMRTEFKNRATRLRQKQKDAIKARVILRKTITANMRRAKLGAIKMRDEDTINTAEQLISQVNTVAQNQAFVQANDTLKDYLDSRDKYYKEFQEKSETLAMHLMNYLQNKAKTITFRLAREYNMAPNSSDQVAVENELIAYSTTLAEDFATKGRSFGHALMRGLGIMSRSMETGGASMGNVLYNIFAFITGPWTIMTIMMLVFFFFVLTYVGYSVQMLWIMPSIGAVATFLINFSDSFQPMDWITHLSSGAVAGYSVSLFMIALGMPGWGWVGGSSTMTFWIIWLILGFVVLFQFYQNGGWKVILQGSLIILLFAYLALGPYQAYFYQITDQVKAPIEIVYNAVEHAVTDVWLLATNPTEWYARQQVVNVRPEKPLDVPKGLELSSLDALPASVPAGQSFALTTVIKNDGVLDAATDVMLSLGCNQWCDATYAVPSSIVPPGEFISSDTYAAARDRIGPGLVSAITSGKMFYIKDGLLRGESTIVNVQPFVSLFLAQRAAEANFARVSFNLSYIYAAKSSLQVSVISADELQRMFRDNEPVFKSVVAIGKGTPAQLSLNVGPQPLQAGNRSLLLVSVSNGRDDSKVVLLSGSNITIKLPSSVGKDLRCGDYRDDGSDKNAETVNYIINPQGGDNVEILANEFQSIYAFICTFTASDNVTTTRTDLVTASLPRYIFRIEQTKDVPITPPLGILFDPYSAKCKTCGAGIFTSCAVDECHAISDSNKNAVGTCYYDAPGGAIQKVMGNVCFSCGTDPTCDQFNTQNACEGEGPSRCGIRCTWVPGAVHKVSGVDLTGACTPTEIGKAMVPFTPFTGSIAERIVQEAKAAGFSKTDAENVLKIALQESGLKQCKDGTLNCGSNNIDNVLGSSDGKSYGVFQLNQDAHKDWYTASNNLCNGQLPYDLDCNIHLGVGYIMNRYTYTSGLGPKAYYCLGVKYTGWDATFRLYNGWPATCAGDPQYVSHVKSQDTSPYRAIIEKVYGADVTPGSGWTINGKIGKTEVGKLGDDTFYAQLVNVNGKTFSINLFHNDGSGENTVDCYWGIGLTATLTEGDEVECDTRSGLNPIAIVSGDDVNLKLQSVDYSNRNILLSVGEEPFYGPSRNPLADWQLCANNLCAPLGRMIDIHFTNDISARIAVSDVSSDFSSATFVAYTQTSAGWSQADCSSWPLRKAVTLNPGEKADCASGALIQFTNDFSLRLDKIDKDKKIIYISIPEFPKVS